MAAKKTATIQDVARLAKVSISTVSHVLNNTRHVESATQGRILSIIEELNYRPNMLARGLRGAGSKTIGVIISDIREEFFSEMTKTIESAANERGYMVVLCDSEESSEKESNYLEILAARGIDGIVLAPVNCEARLRLPRGWKLPIVLVDRHCAGADMDFVGIDNMKWATAAVAHFASLGRRKLGFIGHERSIATMSERADGFAKAAEELYGEGSGKVLTIDSRGRDSKTRIKRWLKASPGLEGIVCGNANICFEALEALEELGIEVPGGMGVLSFDDLECFRFMRSPITAIRQPTDRIGLSVFDALIARISGERTGAGIDQILPAKLVVRESCGAGRARR